MKTILSAMVMVMMTQSALAQTTTEEFVAKLVDTINQQIVIKNKARAKEGKGLYCRVLNQRQVDLIVRSFENRDGSVRRLENISATTFIQSVGDDLNCYPKPCKDYADLVHGICNMRAYHLNMDLLRDSLNAMKGSRVKHFDMMSDIAK